MKNNFTKINVKSALHKVKGNFPFHWDLNVYRGCAHGCVYCYALYSHDYLQADGDFYHKIYVKENLVEVLEKELRKKSWKGEMVNLGGVTDSYQPLEKSMEMMRDILKLFIKYRNPLTISTKSDLILRDIDLYAQLANLTHVNVSVTITTPDESIRQKIEPSASDSARRFDVLKAFSRTSVSTGLHIMPIIPFVTDDKDDLEALFQKASQCHVDYLLTGKLYLRGKTRPRFIGFMREEFDKHFQQFARIYNQEAARLDYTTRLNAKIKQLRNKYHIGIYQPPKLENQGQLRLF
ncbi:MAG TPA: radical SAM protein [Thermotogota bacterium]|nr:radical SAM protein [Thermotogota bacterium]